MRCRNRSFPATSSTAAMPPASRETATEREDKPSAAGEKPYRLIQAKRRAAQMANFTNKSHRPLVSSSLSSASRTLGHSLTPRFRVPTRRKERGWTTSKITAGYITTTSNAATQNFFSLIEQNRSDDTGTRWCGPVSGEDVA